jgi:hypothetical protein
MFRNTLPSPLADTDVIEHAADLVPLSHLALDLDVPPIGWAAYLNNIGVEIVTDDLGREAIHRHDARRLIAEHRDDEVRKAEVRAAAEKRAIEDDQAFRRGLGVGVPTSVIPADSTYAQAALASQLNELDYRPKRTSLMEEVFSNSKEMVIHPLERDEVDWP